MKYVLLWMTVLGAAGAAVAQEQTVNLRPQFEEGRVTRYEIWSQRDQTKRNRFQGQEQSFDTHYTLTGEITWKTLKVRADGSADCEMTFDFLAMEIIEAQGKTHTVDTRKGAGDFPEMHKYLRATTGKPIGVRVNEDGSIEKVTGVEAIIRATPDEMEKPKPLDFKEMASGLAVLIAAPAELSPGGTWDGDFAWNHEMGTLKYKTRHTLTDVGELSGVTVAMVSSQSKLTMDFDRSEIPPDAPPMQTKLTRGEESYQLVFDLSRGEMVAHHGTRTLQAVITIRTPQGPMVIQFDETVAGQIVRISEE